LSSKRAQIPDGLGIRGGENHLTGTVLHDPIKVDVLPGVELNGGLRGNLQCKEPLRVVRDLRRVALSVCRVNGVSALATSVHQFEAQREHIDTRLFEDLSLSSLRPSLFQLVFGARDALPGEHVTSLDEEHTQVTGVDHHQNGVRNFPRPNRLKLRAAFGQGRNQLMP